MFYICFDPNKTISFLSAGRFISHNTHAHPKRKLESAVLLLGYSGECALAQDGREYVLKKGAFQILFPHTLHYGTKPTTQNQSHFWCHFLLPEGFAVKEAESVEELTQEGLCVIPEYIQLRNCEKFLVLFSQMIDEAEKQKAPDTAICDCYIKILLLSLARQCRGCTSTATKSNAMTERIKEWVRLHACEGITVRDVAAAFTYNPDYLTQLIKADTGMTLCGYINNVRLAMAKDLLLNSNLYIAQIAYKVGFSDEKYFIKLFQRKENVTPTQYRNSYSRTHINNK